MSASPELDQQRQRFAKNQSLFREVNEHIEDIATPSSFTRFVCECVRPDCNITVEITLPEYEAVRNHPNRFFVIDGHQVEAVEEVVETTERYLVVSKLGKGAAVAEHLDPRNRQRLTRAESEHDDET
jgi:hypothetical protein